MTSAHQVPLKIRLYEIISFHSASSANFQFFFSSSVIARFLFVLQQLQLDWLLLSYRILSLQSLLVLRLQLANKVVKLRDNLLVNV